MIVGIGCDIVEHEITRTLNWESDISALNRIFTKKELGFCPPQKKLSFLSGRFAAKEAVFKCLGTGMQDGIAFTSIQILQLLNGQPQIELLGEVKKIADTLGINFWHVSITHSSNYSMAIATAEKM